MDAAWAVESRLTPEAADFVRFCYRRRRVGWPELYDEMCAVASRGLFRGWGPDELSQQGVGFGLFELPALAALVLRIIAEEHPGAREHARRPGLEPPPGSTADAVEADGIAGQVADPHLHVIEVRIARDPAAHVARDSAAHEPRPEPALRPHLVPVAS